MGVALPRPFGRSVMRDKISKIFWSTAYSMLKELWKNIHPFSCYNFLNKKRVWPFHALLGGPACSTKFQKYFGPQHTRCKRNHGKVFFRFLVIIF